MHNDFCNLIEKIHKVAEKLETEGTDQNERLNTFEQRIMDIKISDADQFFLNKEEQLAFITSKQKTPKLPLVECVKFSKRPYLILLRY